MLHAKRDPVQGSRFDKVYERAYKPNSVPISPERSRSCDIEARSKVEGLPFVIALIGTLNFVTAWRLTKKLAMVICLARDIAAGVFATAPP